jgi:ubiquinone/menaquinone biosynthesis C-methylase UbiE
MSKKGDFYRGVTAEAYETRRSKSGIWQRENSVIEEFFEELKIPEQALVLDVPVGTGRFVDVYSKHRCQLIGVDISDEMLDQARARATSNEIFTQADITLMPIAESSIDVAVCIRFAYLVDRKTLKAAIQELSRVIRPGGWLIIGARLESFNATSDDANRLLSYLRRKWRTAQFRLGTADSRSESERWMFKALRGFGFRLAHRREITTYPDGSYYSIIVLAAPREQDLQQAPRSVELFGLPGAGKTTLNKALHRVTGDTVVDGYEAIEELSLLQCFLKRPVFTIRLFVRLLPVARELRHLAAKKVVLSALRQHSVRNLPTSPVVFEEGTSHEVWRQLVTGQSLSDDFISIVLPVADTTVLMEAPRDTLADRLRSKPSPGPISRMLANEPIDSITWDLAESAYLRIKASLKSVGAETVVLQNTGDVTEGVKALKRVIDEVP